MVLPSPRNSSPRSEGRKHEGADSERLVQCAEDFFSTEARLADRPCKQNCRTVCRDPLPNDTASQNTIDGHCTPSAQTTWGGRFVCEHGARTNCQANNLEDLTRVGNRAMSGFQRWVTTGFSRPRNLPRMPAGNHGGTEGKFILLDVRFLFA